MRHVLGIDAGGSKTVALLADEAGRVLGRARCGGANLRMHGELEVEKVLHRAIEEAVAEGRARADALVLGMAGADRAEDASVLHGILRRIGFREHAVVTNDARIAFVAGSASRVGLAVVCGTGSIAWGRNARGQTARAGGWGWRLGDEGAGFWIGERGVRAALRASDGRGPATRLVQALHEHFALTKTDELLRAVYDEEFPRQRVADFAAAVGAAARSADPVALEILDAAGKELALAAGSVRTRLGLDGTAHDVVLSGGTFATLSELEAAVATRLSAPGVRVEPLREDPAMGAVRLAIEELSGLSAAGVR